MTLKTNVLGYPRVGSNRELKKAEEAYWAGKASKEELLKTAAEIRKSNWLLQKEAGIDLIPSNDFSFYDQTLDLSLCVGAIPERYNALKNDRLDLYFAMAHGYQKNGIDVTAMEMTKWFDTNYHYIVPEFAKNQEFTLLYNKAAEEFKEALALGIKTKPVIIGPITYLLLGKEKESGFNRVDLIDKLLPVYLEILRQLESLGAEYVQIDEPILATDIDENIKSLYLADNTDLATELNVDVLHIDLVRAPQQWKNVVSRLKGDTILSLGIVDGRNIWKNDFAKSLEVIEGVKSQLGENRVIISTSCSLLHSPFDLDNEKNEKSLPAEVKRWMAFARQKVNEVVTLAELAGDAPSEKAKLALKNNILDIENRRSSALTNNEEVKKRMAGITPAFSQRKSPFATRIKEQRRVLNLPLFPTTTIGSFPQTVEVRSWRSKFKKGEISRSE